MDDVQWFYEDGQLLDTLKKAVTRFREKTNRAANIVWFYPNDVVDDEVIEWMAEGGLDFERNKYVTTRYFRVGRVRKDGRDENENDEGDDED